MKKGKDIFGKTICTTPKGNVDIEKELLIRQISQTLRNEDAVFCHELLRGILHVQQSRKVLPFPR